MGRPLNMFKLEAMTNFGVLGQIHSSQRDPHLNSNSYPFMGIPAQNMEISCLAILTAKIVESNVFLITLNLKQAFKLKYGLSLKPCTFGAIIPCAHSLWT